MAELEAFMYTYNDPDCFTVPFTNQLAYQTAFTPAGFSFESPFLNQPSPDMSWQQLPGKEGNGSSSKEPPSLL